MDTVITEIVLFCEIHANYSIEDYFAFTILQVMSFVKLISQDLRFQELFDLVCICCLSVEVYRSIPNLNYSIEVRNRTCYSFEDSFLVIQLWSTAFLFIHQRLYTVLNSMILLF